MHYDAGMSIELLTTRHKDQIVGVLSCYDRILIQGTVPGWCYAAGMTDYFYKHQLRIFDYPKWAEPLREELRQNMERIAAENALQIEFVRSRKSFRKEDRVKQILEKRGEHPGVVCILSAMEPCGSYQPWHDKTSHKTYLKPDDGKCLHYYVYFLDDDLGLCSLRVPTWCPFRLQFYCNGHSYLARQMSQRHLDYRALDNAFSRIADFQQAQKLADEFGVQRLHRKLDSFADRYCPVVKQCGLAYHWSLDQVEFATDIVFRQQSDLQAIYERLTRTAIHTVKPDNIATFLGRKLNGNYQDEMGNRFNTRLEGTRIKHTMGPVSIKMYDKFHLILRIETTVVNVSFFKHYREVEHQDGTRSMAWAEMKKSIYSLAPLRGSPAGGQPPLPGVHFRHPRRHHRYRQAQQDLSARRGQRPLLSRLQLLRSTRRRTIPIPGQRRVQHQRLSEQRPASAREGQKHRANLSSHETPANARSH